MTTIDTSRIAESVALMCENYEQAIADARTAYNEARSAMSESVTEASDRAELESVLAAYVAGKDKSEPLATAWECLDEMRENGVKLPEDRDDEFRKHIRLGRCLLYDATDLEKTLSGVGVNLSELNHGADTWTLRTLLDLLARQFDIVAGNF